MNVHEVFGIGQDPRVDLRACVVALMKQTRVKCRGVILPEFGSNQHNQILNKNCSAIEWQVSFGTELAKLNNPLARTQNISPKKELSLYNAVFSCKNFRI